MRVSAPAAKAVLEAVIAPTLLNAWANNGGGFLAAGYYKNAGEVALQGRVNSGSNGTIAFTLPVGYRIAGTAYLATSSESVTDPGFVEVVSDGSVLPYRAGASSVGLETRFRAG